VWVFESAGQLTRRPASRCRRGGLQPAGEASTAHAGLAVPPCPSSRRADTKQIEIKINTLHVKIANHQPERM